MLVFLVCVFLYIQVGAFTWVYYIKRCENDVNSWKADADGFFLGIFWPLYWNYRLLKILANIVTEK